MQHNTNIFHGPDPAAMGRKEPLAQNMSVYQVAILSFVYNNVLQVTLYFQVSEYLI